MRVMLEEANSLNPGCWDPWSCPCSELFLSPTSSALPYLMTYLCIIKNLAGFYLKVNFLDDRSTFAICGGLWITLEFMLIREL